MSRIAKLIDLSLDLRRQTHLCKLLMGLWNRRGPTIAVGLETLSLVDDLPKRPRSRCSDSPSQPDNADNSSLLRLTQQQIEVH